MWPYTQLQVEYFCQHLFSRILFSQRLCHQKLSFLKMIIPVSCQTVSRSESQALAAVVQLWSWKGFLTFYSPVRKASSAKAFWGVGSTLLRQPAENLTRSAKTTTEYHTRQRNFYNKLKHCIVSRFQTMHTLLSLPSCCMR